MSSRRYRSTATVLLAVIAVIAVVWFLRISFAVSMPVAAAIYLAMLVAPVQRWIDRRVPGWLRWLGAVAGVLLIIFALIAFLGAIGLAGTLASEKLPQYGEQLRQSWERLTSWAGGHGVSLRGFATDGWRERLGDWLTRGVRSATAIVSGVVLILFLVLLILLEACRWQDKVRASLRQGRAAATLDTVLTVASKVRHYLLARTMLGAVTAVLEGVWLWVIGVELALVWAMLFFFLNYIPTLGSILAAIPPALVALLTLGPGRALAAIAGMFVIEQVMGNYVDPRFVGRQLSLSPLVVLIAVVFWGWIWGVAGALLAVPMTATLVVACAHVDALRPLALMLSGTNSEQELMERTSDRGSGES